MSDESASIPVISDSMHWIMIMKMSDREGRLTVELTTLTIKCNTIKYNKITRPT